MSRTTRSRARGGGSSPRAGGGGVSRAGAGEREAVIWHDLECGSYRADLPLWRELAERFPGPALELGAGSGRVALELARAGRHVTAVELDPALANALRERAAGLDIDVVCADVRALRLARRDFTLCVVAMQTLHLLGGHEGRLRTLVGARAHLRDGGLVACAILATVESFDRALDGAGPDPERILVGDSLYVSRPLRVAESRDRVLIERERAVLGPSAGARASARAGTAGAPDGAGPAGAGAQRDVVELDVVSEEQLHREARRVGLRPEASLAIAPTDDHAGSTVVMLRG